MKKNTILMILGGLILVALLVFGLVALKKKLNPVASNVKEEEVDLDLPINTIPLSERPFITLSPDSTGRTLDFMVSQAPQEGELEYELVYQTVEVEEGVFGRLDLEGEKQPITKALLLGSKSAGGKVTYHEGVKSGNLTVTYGTTRLKESFNYLEFDPTDPIILSSDGRFVVTLSKTALKEKTRVLTMKTFGYPKTGLPEDTNILAGPYHIAYATVPKGDLSVELKLPAGEHTNPTIYGWDGKSWSKLKTIVGEDSVRTVSKTTSYLVMVD